MESSLYADGNRRDCINSVSVHPYSSLLIGSSGQRHFDNQYAEEEDMVYSASLHPIDSAVSSAQQSFKVEHIENGLKSSNVSKKDGTVNFNSGLHIWRIPYNKLAI